MRYFRTLRLLPLLVLTACATAPGIPDTTYFRLPPRADIAPVAATQARAIVVDTLLADGLHSDQALIYSLDPEAGRLKAYHYQLWVDPPVRMLQRRLIATLRDARVAHLVADRLPAQADAIRVEGRLERFERVRGPDGWFVMVALSLRADVRDGQPPLVLREYRRERPAGGSSVQDSVRAMGQAVDEIFAEFATELAAATGHG